MGIAEPVIETSDFTINKKPVSGYLSHRDSQDFVRGYRDGNNAIKRNTPYVSQQDQGEFWCGHCIGRGSLRAESVEFKNKSGEQALILPEMIINCPTCRGIGVEPENLKYLSARVVREALS